MSEERLSRWPIRTGQSRGAQKAHRPRSACRPVRRPLGSRLEYPAAQSRNRRHGSGGDHDRGRTISYRPAQRRQRATQTSRAASGPSSPLGASGLRSRVRLSLLSSGSRALSCGRSESQAIVGSRRAARPRRASPSRAPRDKGRANVRRSVRSDTAAFAQPAQSARAPRRSSRGLSLAPSPRRERDCRALAPAGRSPEDGPARSTLLLPGAERHSESRARGRGRLGGPTSTRPS